MVAISWHQILVFRSKFQQSTHRNQHFAASGLVYHILMLSFMPCWWRSYLKDKLYSGGIKKGEDLRKVFGLIEKVNDVQFNLEHNTIYIEEK